MPEMGPVAPDGGIELTRPGNVLLAACTALGIAAGSFALSSCGGGGGGGARTSAPLAVITPPGGSTIRNPRQNVAVPLTGVNIVLHSSRPRKVLMLATTEPEGSVWSGMKIFVEPPDAGTPCCSRNFRDGRLFEVNCTRGYYGDAVAKVKANDIGGNGAEGFLTFTCR